MRRTWRRVRMGLATVTGLARQGFFIPYRYAAQTASTPSDAFSGVSKACRDAEPSFQNLLETINGYGESLSEIGSAPPPAPRWRQDWFPGLDAACAYALVRSRKPNRIVEIGCGHSTRFYARALLDEGLDTRLTAIDPAPRADLRGVGVAFIEATIQQALERDDASACFSNLAAGDVLSIDSSHILMPGTDVDILLNRILPMLSAGVLIHIHDMFLPDDYPASWEWRGYNEQLGVAPLLEGGVYSLLWSSHYVRSRMADAVAAGEFTGTMHLPDGAFESSLWIVKNDRA